MGERLKVMVYGAGKGKVRYVVSAGRIEATKLFRNVCGFRPVVTLDEDEIEVAKRRKGTVFYTDDGGETWFAWNS